MPGYVILLAGVRALGGGLHDRRPVEPAVPSPELVQAGRNSRDAARRDADGVVDQLGAERNVELEQLRLARRGSEARHRDDAPVGGARDLGSGLPQHIFGARNKRDIGQSASGRTSPSRVASSKTWTNSDR